MRYLKSIIVAAGLCLGMGACTDEVLDLDPLSNPTDATFFADANQLQLALNGVYGQLLWSSSEGMPVVNYMETILTDNGLYRVTDESNGLRALSNSVHDANSGFDGIYSGLYKAIGRANNMLQNMDRAKDVVEPSEYDDFEAQALTLRAYYYHYLIEFFGDVPFMDFLPTTTTGGFIPRTPKSEIVDQLLSDLDIAESKVNKSLSGAQDRITVAVIQGLKARIALYAGRNSEAAIAADKAIASALSQGIALDSNYEELFTLAGETSSEIMMRIPYEETFKRSHNLPLRMGYRFGSIYSQMVPTQNLVDAYPTINGLPIDQDPEYNSQSPWENRDPRMRASIVFPQDEWGGYIYESHRDSLKTTKIVDGVRTRVTNEDCRSAQWPAALSGFLWRKYVDIDAVANNESIGYNDIILMRLGELYLIKAEAEIEANGDLSAAADALNELRSRAWGDDSYPRVSVSDQGSMRKILRMERRAELANEGFRYIDIIRWKIAEKVRNAPLIGRHLDLPNATIASLPTIDEDGVVTYSDKSEYDDWRSLRVDGEIVADGYDSRLNGNWQNAHERNFTAPRDYLLPIPQAEVYLYEANGFTISQNTGY